MLLPFKDKGGLIVVYLVVSTLVVAWFFGYLNREKHVDVNMYEGFSVILLVTAIWTYFTKDDYYKDNEGNKVFVDIDNRLLFIKMKYWVYIFLAGAIILFLYSF